MTHSQAFPLDYRFKYNLWQIGVHWNWLSTFFIYLIQSIIYKIETLPVQCLQVAPCLGSGILIKMHCKVSIHSSHLYLYSVSMIWFRIILSIITQYFGIMAHLKALHYVNLFLGKHLKISKSRWEVTRAFTNKTSW